MKELLSSLPKRKREGTGTVRARRARKLAVAMKLGDSAAAKSLSQRAAALRGIRKLGWAWRLELANKARDVYFARRRLEKARAAAQATIAPYLESTREL